MAHVLIHMGLLGGRETSETIARMLNTNPVVVRRSMGALRRKGIVASEGGRGGGWTLLLPLERISLLDVGEAMEAGSADHQAVPPDHPGCPVERASRRALTLIHDATRATMRDLLRATSLSSIAAKALADPSQ